MAFAFEGCGGGPEVEEDEEEGDGSNGALEGDGIAGASVAFLLAINLGPGGVATGFGPRLAPVRLPMVTAILQFLSSVRVPADGRQRRIVAPPKKDLA